MDLNMRKLTYIILGAALLTGCGAGALPEAVSHLDTADVGQYPDNYKEIVKSAIDDILKDPDTAKFYDFTPPRKEVAYVHGVVYGYSSCVVVNAKNAYGGYTGKTLYWVFMRDNKVLRIQNTSELDGDYIYPGRHVNCT